MKWVALLIVLVALSSVPARADERHPMRGVVLKIDPVSRTMFVSIEKVPGYMDAMMMPFSVRRAAALDGLKPGATIEFVFVIEGNASFADDIRVRAYENLEQEPQ